MSSNAVLSKKFWAFAAILIAAAGLCAQIPFLAESKGFSFEGGVSVEMVVEGNSALVGFHPDLTLYFDEVKPDGRPTREAAFLDHVGSAAIAANIYAEGAERDPQQGSGSLYNTMLGFDARLHWVWDVVPISLGIPLSDTRIRWRYSEDDTAAVLSYHMLAIEPGWYILPSTEISLGIGYVLPDLFYKVTPGTSIYSYLAWDISMLSARVKSVFSLPAHMWLAAEGSLTKFEDSEDNTVSSAGLNLTYYPLPSMGIGFAYSSSSYTEGGTHTNPLFSVMGVTSFEGIVTLELFPWLGLRLVYAKLVPEDTDYAPVGNARAIVSIRL